MFEEVQDQDEADVLLLLLRNIAYSLESRKLPPELSIDELNDFITRLGGDAVTLNILQDLKSDDPRFAELLGDVSEDSITLNTDSSDDSADDLGTPEPSQDLGDQESEIDSPETDDQDSTDEQDADMLGAPDSVDQDMGQVDDQDQSGIDDQPLPYSDSTRPRPKTAVSTMAKRATRARL